MKHILEHLENLGLSEKQARVYVALLELGRGTAYAVAKRAGVKRPTVYVLLDELRMKDLVLKIPHSKKQIFIAKNPEEFFAQAEERLQQARRILPNLLARAGSGGNRVKTFFFEGSQGVKQALAYNLAALAGKELLCYYAKSEGGSIPRIYVDYNAVLVKQKTRIRSFVPRHASLSPFRRFDRLPERKTITLSESEFSPNASVEIADGFVRILLHRDTQALIVENKDFADMMRQAFEMLWTEKAS